jgi:hypothetical protein
VNELLLAVVLSLLQITGSGPTDAAAIKQFNVEIAKYMAIRRGLLTEVPGPKPESTSVQLNNDADALAAAIRRRRPDAKPGMLFTPAVAEAIKIRVSQAVLTANLGPILAGIDDENQGIDHPTIYLRFPAAAQLATMPPSLLEVLPVLPKELEYRIVGSYLVLRDTDAALILDFIPAAVPRK